MSPPTMSIVKSGVVVTSGGASKTTVPGGLSEVWSLLTLTAAFEADEFGGGTSTGTEEVVVEVVLQT